jgi:hypothetical protein
MAKTTTKTRGEIKGKTAPPERKEGIIIALGAPRRAGNGWIWIGKEVQYLMTPCFDGTTYFFWATPLE